MVGTHVVLIHGLQPSDVVVGVRNQVNVEFSGDKTGRGIVGEAGERGKWKDG